MLPHEAAVIMMTITFWSALFFSPCKPHMQGLDAKHNKCATETPTSMQAFLGLILQV